jgi:hypothetical protein
MYRQINACMETNKKNTLASVAEVRVALVTIIAFACVAGASSGGGNVVMRDGEGGGMAGGVAAMARGGAQISWARCVPGARWI